MPLLALIVVSPRLPPVADNVPLAVVVKLPLFTRTLSPPPLLVTDELVVKAPPDTIETAPAFERTMPFSVMIPASAARVVNVTALPLTLAKLPTVNEPRVDVDVMTPEPPALKLCITTLPFPLKAMFPPVPVLIVVNWFCVN